MNPTDLYFGRDPTHQNMAQTSIKNSRGPIWVLGQMIATFPAAMVTSKGADWNPESPSKCLPGLGV